MQERIVVVTGASAGIGRATAVEFGRHGWRVALLARGIDGLEGARREVQQAGGMAMAVPTDVADQAQVEAAAERVERETMSPASHPRISGARPRSLISARYGTRWPRCAA